MPLREESWYNSDINEEKSAEINSETSDVIISVVNKNKSGFPPDSPKHLLWEQRKKLCQLKKKSKLVFDNGVWSLVLTYEINLFW